MEKKVSGRGGQIYGRSGNLNHTFLFLALPKCNQVFKHYPATIFVQEMSSTFMSAEYIQVHFRLDFLKEANNMNSDQTSPKGEVCSGSILFADIDYLRTYSADEINCNWQDNGYGFK